MSILSWLLEAWKRHLPFALNRFFPKAFFAFLKFVCVLKPVKFNVFNQHDYRSISIQPT